MIVGKEIARLGLVRPIKESGFKNATYDLTIGEIYPIGLNAAKELESGVSKTRYFLAPQEMIWVVSHEKFDMPDDISGLATLRTTLTKQGLLALNVGIIDCAFKGRISTAIINFSSITRKIEVGDKFFRVLFFKHENPGSYLHPFAQSESGVSNEIMGFAAAEFPKNFLNIPEMDDIYYGRQFGKMLWGWIKLHWVWFALGVLVVVLNIAASWEKAIELLKYLGLIEG